MHLIYTTKNSPSSLPFTTQQTNTFLLFLCSLSFLQHINHTLHHPLIILIQFSELILHSNNNNNPSSSQHHSLKLPCCLCFVLALLLSAFVPLDLSHNTPFFININIKIPTKRGWWEEENQKSSRGLHCTITKATFCLLNFFSFFPFCFFIDMLRGSSLSSWRNNNGCCLVL